MATLGEKITTIYNGLSNAIDAVEAKVTGILNKMVWKEVNVTIYVRTDGNNNNTGFENTAAGAVKDWTGVFEVLRKLNVRSAAVIIAFQEGTWTGITLCGEQFKGIGTSYLSITGIADKTIFSSDILIHTGLYTDLKDISVKGIIQSRYKSTIYMYRCTCLGADTPVDAIDAMDGGQIIIREKITFSGAFVRGMFARADGFIRTYTDIAITFNNSCSFSNAFLCAGSADGIGRLNIRGTLTYAGTFTGRKYYFYSTNVISGISRTNLAAIPGTIDGINASGTGIVSSTVFYTTGTTTSSNYLLADGTDILDAPSQVMHVQDQKAATVDSGTFTSGAWRRRDLNTTVINTIPGASLTSDIITLPAGTYHVIGTVPAYGAGRHQALLRNSSTSAILIRGTSEYSQTGTATDATSNNSILNGILTITSTTTLEIVHRCSTTFVSFGFGAPTQFDYNVYTNVFIRRLK